MKKIATGNIKLILSLYGQAAEALYKKAAFDPKDYNYDPDEEDFSYADFGPDEDSDTMKPEDLEEGEDFDAIMGEDTEGPYVKDKSGIHRNIYDDDTDPYESDPTDTSSFIQSTVFGPEEYELGGDAREKVKIKSIMDNYGIDKKEISRIMDILGMDTETEGFEDQDIDDIIDDLPVDMLHKIINVKTDEMSVIPKRHKTTRR